MNKNFEEQELEMRGLIEKTIRETLHSLPPSAKSIIDINDLRQDAHVILNRCIELYNPNKNTKFSTYYYRAIKNKMRSILVREWNRYSKWPPPNFTDADFNFGAHCHASRKITIRDLQHLKPMPIKEKIKEE